MTNTYPDNAPMPEKQLEELRLIRCCLERMLQLENGTSFVDYQHEKFSGKFHACWDGCPCQKDDESLKKRKRERFKEFFAGVKS